MIIKSLKGLKRRGKCLKTHLILNFKNKKTVLKMCVKNFLKKKKKIQNAQ